MKVTRLAIPDILVIGPDVFGDDRGFFFESFNRSKWKDATGLDLDFVQDNHSKSARGVLRGLHYQLPVPQGKLVRVISGEIYDVAVDLRQTSSTFGQWVAVTLSADNKKQMWIPEGFAHGFLTMSDFAEVLYKTTDAYSPQHEHCIIWNDASLNISWPLTDAPVLSAKDARGLALADVPRFA